ncbi:MAG TPA: PP2C family protein-serine/threonine phosphatase [Candidatus Sulfotelmatobacter sp.]|nr:PP2C family protein-serine/threonine phosphatase [Candidatus Sulfotelmatobacter sp.]
MSFRIWGLEPATFASPLRRMLRYANASYGWIREMPKPERLITGSGIALQGYVIYCVLMWVLGVPKGLLVVMLVLPKGPLGYLLAWLLFIIGTYVMNGMLGSELIRKAQLEADQIAAQQIQQTLHPQNLEEWQDYKIETYYKPYREVGGDYFDVIELPNNRTLFAVADVSGKGMPAALLAANIQALVRSIANVEPDPLALARQINKHLCRYTPADRFATAVFIVLSRDSGELSYVNAGHDSPIVFCPGATTLLQSTGIPLGLFAGAGHKVGRAVIPPGGALLLFTDGLIDSIRAENPTDRLRDTLADDSRRTMTTVESLVDPKLNADDVTILLLKRAIVPASSSAPRLESPAQQTD